MRRENDFTPDGNPMDSYIKSQGGRQYYEAAKQLEIDKQNSNKRNRLYLILISICVISVCFIAMTANFKTYVVRVDNTTGKIDYSGQLVSSNYEPREAEITYFISEFLKNVRTIPLDPIVYRNNWDTAQHFLTPEASKKLNALMKTENPLQRLGKETTQIQIKSIQLQPGASNTYQVRWSEDVFSIAGTIESGQKEHYVGLFQIAVIPPTKEEELKINPLGLVIKDLTFSKETNIK